jgi:hypothetical protein
MIDLNPHADDYLLRLCSRLNQLAHAGIDPAFDAEMEELERQFAEIRLTFGHN